MRITSVRLVLHAIHLGVDAHAAITGHVELLRPRSAEFLAMAIVRPGFSLEKEAAEAPLQNSISGIPLIVGLEPDCEILVFMCSFGPLASASRSIEWQGMQNCPHSQCTAHSGKPACNFPKWELFKFRCLGASMSGRHCRCEVGFWLLILKKLRRIPSRSRPPGISWLPCPEAWATSKSNGTHYT